MNGYKEWKNALSPEDLEYILHEYYLCLEPEEEACYFENPKPTQNNTKMKEFYMEMLQDNDPELIDLAKEILQIYFQGD